MIDRASRWIRLDVRWRRTPAARRAGRDGREVLLALLELTAEAGWTVNGRRGFVPAEEAAPRQLAYHLGDDEADTEALERLERGIHACVAAGLLVHGDGGYWVADDVWRGALPDRTARWQRKKAEEAEAPAGRDEAEREVSGNARSPAASAATRGKNGERRQRAGHRGNAGRAPGVARSSPSLSSPNDTPQPPAARGAGSDGPEAPNAAPLTASERAAVAVLIDALELGELRCEDEAQFAARERAARHAVSGHPDDRARAEAERRRLTDEERERRDAALAALRGGDPAAAREVLEAHRHRGPVRVPILAASHTAEREARQARREDRERRSSADRRQRIVPADSDGSAPEALDADLAGLDVDEQVAGVGVDVGPKPNGRHV